MGPSYTATFRQNSDNNGIDLGGPPTTQNGRVGSAHGTRRGQWRGKQPHLAGDGLEDRGIGGMSLAIKNKLLVQGAPGRVHNGRGRPRRLQGGLVACGFLEERRNRVEKA